MFKKIRHAVTLGKFYPIHSGHYELIHSASVMADKVTAIVLIDTNRELLIDFNKRVEFVRNSITKYSPYGELTNVCVVPVYHQLETNYDSDDTWNGFCDLIREGIGKSEYKEKVTHYICGDNSYGGQLADMLGLHYIDLDDNRVKHPISATKIRTNPFENWNFINNDVKAYFCKRVVILGAESTGTTTLANDLFKYLQRTYDLYNQVKLIEEYGRKYIQDKLISDNITISDLKLIPEEIEFFAKQQFNLEMNTTEIHGTPLLIADTDAFASQIWFKRYFGYFSNEIEDVINSLPPRTLYVLTSMENIPFEDDGTRDGNDDIRKQMEVDFENELIKRNFPYIKVVGTREQRVKSVLNKLWNNF